MEFELIEDVEGERKLIEKTIRMYGNDPEQNYGYFLAHENKSDKCVFIRKGKYGIQTTFDPKTKEWVMISTPIAPKAKQIDFLYDALEFLSRKRKLKKIVVEFNTDSRKKVISAFGKKYKVHSPSCILYWPVYDMKTWTGDKLKGKEWKKLRNLINRITKTYKLEVIDCVKADKNELKSVISKWVKLRNQTGFGVDRKDSNRTDYDQYQKVVELGFIGCKFAKTVLVNGHAASITAGWEVPNSNGVYYSGIGVYDLGIENLGEYVNWSDLVMLKKAGYREIDFGGSPKPLLQFKQKFKPSRSYTTYIFSIARK